ncbi:zincin-like metallopeptidase domain-containing protein, partial [Massilia pinisoli]|uniref:zincin-like metallopeptidase domain-containing protein n=1 Tax=Massilia pinisoli TaxID=1772194 RepID=UPI003644F6F3
AKIWEKNESIQECEFFLNSLNNKPNLKVKLSDTASYNKAKDLITMPKIQQFLSSEDYYATLFHELVHGTGHTSRLKRPTLMEVEKFGDKNYSKEELVAEIGSSFLCNFFGINTPVLDENQEAYVKGWLKALKEDVKLIFEAATEAQKAFNFLIGQEPIYSKNIQKSDE